MTGLCRNFQRRDYYRRFILLTLQTATDFWHYTREIKLDNMALKRGNGSDERAHNEETTLDGEAAGSRTGVGRCRSGLRGRLGDGRGALHAGAGGD
jgi:hypothetical protein